MNAPQAEQVFEEKMDRITELLEELILDALIGVLEKLSDRNRMFSGKSGQWNCYRSECKHRDDIPF